MKGSEGYYLFYLLLTTQQLLGKEFETTELSEASWNLKSSRSQQTKQVVVANFARLAAEELGRPPAAGPELTGWLPAPEAPVGRRGCAECYPAPRGLSRTVLLQRSLVESIHIIIIILKV